MIPGTHDSGAIRKFDGYFAGSIVNRFFMHYLGTFDVLPTYQMCEHQGKINCICPLVSKSK